MVEVNNKVFERAKTALVQLTHFEHQNVLLAFKIHDETEGRIHFPFAEKDFIGRKRIAYFFLSKLDTLINPLLADITSVGRADIDGNFVIISKYFEYLTWAVRQCLNPDIITDPFYYPVYSSSHRPLEEYVSENQRDKRDMKQYAEQVYLAMGRIRSEYFPDETIVIPTKETATYFEPIEAFIKEYKRAIETAALDAKIGIEAVQHKFAHPDVAFDAATSVLNFQGKSIEISKTKNSDPHYLLAFLFKDKGKIWAYDEVWDDPYFKGRNPEYDPQKDWRKIYNAAYSVNEKVAKATTIADFLVVSKTELHINKAYL